MAKAFLLRWGTQNDFDSIKLAVRELGFAVDVERLYIGGNDENIHIPNEAFLKEYVASEVPKYKPIAGTTQELLSLQTPGALAYNTDENRMTYMSPIGSIYKFVTLSDMPLSAPFSVKVLSENIEESDNNSVTIQGYNRPIEMIYLNGRLCTTHSDDPNRYEVDRDAQTLKIYNCAENDIIAYF